MRKQIAIMAITACAMAFATSAQAEQVGAVDASGWMLPDQILVEAFDDPNIEGVSCYLTRYDRWSPFKEDSGSTSLSCRQTGVIKGTMADNPDVFSSKLNIYFKTKKVARFGDPKRNVLVYLAYTRKTSGDNKDHSLSVVVVR